MEPFIHDCTHDTTSMPIGNSQLFEIGYESCLLYFTVTSIELKVFTFQHGLNIGRNILIQAINNSSLSTMNKRKFVLQALLTLVISDLLNLLVSYKTISENKKQLAFHFS